jgi:hypothetical protein
MRIDFLLFKYLVNFHVTDDPVLKWNHSLIFRQSTNIIMNPVTLPDILCPSMSKHNLFFEIVTHITLILNSKLSYIYKCINYNDIWRSDIFVWLDLWIVNIVMWD